MLEVHNLRKMGLDFGNKTIGIAVSDALGLTAQAKDVIKRTNLRDDLCIIKDYLEKYKIDEIVVGMPRNMDGTKGESARKVQAFVNFLKNNLDLEITLWDERLTSVQAEKILLTADLSRDKRKKVIDQLAAAIILQSYLENGKNNNQINHK